MKVTPWIALVLVFADITLGLWFLHAQPSSAGKPPYPPPYPAPYPPYPVMPVYYPYPTNQPYQQQFAVGTDFVANGEWKVVCKNWECGATNKLTPAKTNVVIIETGTGGRSVDKWIMMKCPVCHVGFSNRFESVWVPDVPPLPVLIATNFNEINTNKAQR